MLRDSGSIDFNELDQTETCDVTYAFSSAEASAGAVISDDLNAILRDLSNTFTISGDGVGTRAANGTVTWNFEVDQDHIQYLAVGLPPGTGCDLDQLQNSK